MDLTTGERTVIGIAKSKLLYRLFRQNWNIAVTNHPVAVVAGLKGAPKQREALSDLVWMNEARGSFFADPFVMSSNENPEEATIFYEHFDWKKGRGRIDCVSYNKSIRAFGPAKKSFESPFHLSYPYLLHHNGTYLYAPEHSEAKDVSFYELGPDGVAGDKRTIIPQVGLIDSTIVFWNDLYWMFATVAGTEDNSHLHIFFSPELFGPWTPHERNPVKVDRSNARPAGQPIIHKGTLFRPAQDCANHYGSAIIINEVTHLSKSDFSEAPVAEIRPEPGTPYDFGLHTISSADEVTVIDGARLESRLHPILDRFSSYFH